MARSTPGTRLRRQLVADAQLVRNILDGLKSHWKARGTVFEEVTEEGRVVRHAWRARREDEYPEASLESLSAAHSELDRAISILSAQREQIGAHWTALYRATQQKDKGVKQ